ncbi:MULTISPECIES: hypothetical protein [unclassified Streptomyces]|uniref:hypothetical protein n=1 Tax=unclassified Streptomyces TaxID=2593676 RepID=UPI001F54731F|nr:MULTISPECIES: hypothetical protein [unclassified Streptomyces]
MDAQIVSQDYEVLLGVNGSYDSPACPAGTTPISGGMSANGLATALGQSYPNGDHWTVTATAGALTTITVYAICS